MKSLLSWKKILFCAVFLNGSAFSQDKVLESLRQTVRGAISCDKHLLPAEFEKKSDIVKEDVVVPWSVDGFDDVEVIAEVDQFDCNLELKEVSDLAISLYFNEFAPVTDQSLERLLNAQKKLIQFVLSKRLKSQIATEAVKQLLITTPTDQFLALRRNKKGQLRILAAKSLITSLELQVDAWKALQKADPSVKPTKNYISSTKNIFRLIFAHPKNGRRLSSKHSIFKDDSVIRQMTDIVEFYNFK